MTERVTKRYNVAWEDFMRSFRRLREMVLKDGGDIQMNVKVKAGTPKKRRADNGNGDA